MKETLFVLFGRSCVGKTTSVRKLQQKYPDLHEAVSVTTRSPRPGEIDGFDYIFVSREEFQRMERDNELVENIQYNGNNYGLAFRSFNPDKVNIAVIEPNGLKQVQERLSDKFNIVVIKMDENDSTLLERFAKRGDPIEVRDKRIYGDKSHFSDVPFNYLINSEPELLEFIMRKHSKLGQQN